MTEVDVLKVIVSIKLIGLSGLVIMIAPLPTTEGIDYP